MAQVEGWVYPFAYLVAFLFGVLLFTVASSTHSVPVELFIFFVLFSASVGLIFKKAWARKLIRAASIGGVVYFTLKQFFILRALDLTALSMLGICAILIYFYRDSVLGTVSRVQPDKATKWTILVVDDDLTFVKLVKAHFLKHGVTVISSDSGERGLEMAKHWKPDLIILDVILPGMKGRTVCSKLKENADTSDIPVMFVTFKNSLDDISAEMELGALMHLTKPVNYDHLYEQVYKVLIKV